jgi:sialidase-1
MAPATSSLAAAALAAAAAAALLPLPAAAFTSTPLFTAYTGYPNCYRQPILAALPGGSAAARAASAAASASSSSASSAASSSSSASSSASASSASSSASTSSPLLLAFIEGRPNISWCSGTEWPDTPAFPLLVRASADGGATFGPAVTIAEGNLDFFVVIPDAASGVVHLLTQVGDTGVAATSSSDGGATWAPLANLSITNLGDFNYSAVIPGVGHGIALSPAHCLDPSCAGTAGRLVAPFVCTTAGAVANDTACGNCHTCLLLSDDGGATWRLGGLSGQEGSREAALVQLDSGAFGATAGVVYASERNLGNATGTRWHAISVDGGATFAPALTAFDPALPDVVTANWTGVVSGAARFDTGGPGTGAPAATRLLVTAPAAPGARADLSVFVSGDEGATWSAGATLWAGPAAYSDLLAYNSTHTALLFECGATEFAGQVNFGFLTAADLPPPPPPRPAAAA